MSTVSHNAILYYRLACCAYDAIATVAKLNADYFRVGFQKIEAKSPRELMDIDPAEDYRDLQIPVFLFGGEKDVQCAPEDCHRLAELLGANAAVHIEPDLTHVLRKDTRPPSIFTYPDQLKHQPDPVVAEHVIDWLNRQT